MDSSNSIIPVDKNESKQILHRSIDEIMQENLELMYNIQKNRNNFCSMVGGC